MATQNIEYQTGFADQIRPFAETLLGKAQLLTDYDKTPYQPYMGGDVAHRIAQFTDLQKQAFGGAGSMQGAPQIGAATDMATQAGLGALANRYAPGQFANQFNAPGQYQPGQFNAQQAFAPGLYDYQMQAPERTGFERTGAERIGTQSFVQPGAAEAYMSPYMQSVVEMQKREAARQSGIQGTQQQAQAAQAGAFGGSRDAIMRAERERNLGQQMGDIQATGSQAAYQQAQQQFNAEQAARLQAAQANQQTGLQSNLANQQAGMQTGQFNAQMGYNVGQQNLAARLGTQQFGAGQNLQAQLANQQAMLNAQQAAEQSRQFGAGQGMTGAQAAAQYGQAAQQLGEQSRQYGAGLGMQGYQTALQGAGQLGQLGQTQFGQGMDINKLQQQYGTQQQQQVQNVLGTQYQDWQNQQNYPYKQLGFMSDIIRGAPLAQTGATSYTSPPSTLSQVAGLGATAYGMTKMAKGGQVKSPRGLAALVVNSIQ